PACELIFSRLTPDSGLSPFQTERSTTSLSIHESTHWHTCLRHCRCAPSARIIHGLPFVRLRACGPPFTPHPRHLLSGSYANSDGHLSSPSRALPSRDALLRGTALTSPSRSS
ncbi:uncharacterized protein STEHIDRAFT_144156, partial [Stereum hirsutum FP-91666 SS1]|uniref:uncharacterized protein n=1 Tax=Stereum hirsutum (strain FP-91666) TaxID=721885 RepID=UPI000440D6B9